jgi:cytochrome c biogenesis protein CcdA
MIATLGLAFLAGALSILSPCVLPLIPLVIGAAAAAHRFGPLALALGMAGTFVLVGLFVATIGFSIGLDGDALRIGAAVVMIIVGAVLIVPSLQARVAAAAGPVSRWADAKLAALSPSGLAGQFATGLLIGIAWSPCVGPTLGAATLLASQGKDLFQVALTMLCFGFGAAAPLIVAGLVSREIMLRLRAQALAAGFGLKAALGAAFVLIGTAIVTGIDRLIETALVEASPQWLTQLTTRF